MEITQKNIEGDDTDKQNNIDELEYIMKEYINIRSKSEKIIPILDGVIQDLLQIQRNCKKSQIFRTIRLDRKLAVELLIRALLISKTQLINFKKISERAEHNTDGINEVL